MEEIFADVLLGDGNCDPVQTVKTLKDARFNGFLIDDHVPHMVNDSPWSHRGRAWSTGYIKALVDAVNGLN